MRYILTAILLVALIAGGCTEKNYTGTGPDGANPAQIVSPSPGTTVETIYHWRPSDSGNSNPCQWGFASDTSHFARVTVKTGGGAYSAKVYWQIFNHYSYYIPQGDEIHPEGETFDIEYLKSSFSGERWMQPDTIVGAFHIEGMTLDYTPYRTDAIPVRWIIRTDETLTAPQPPVIDTVFERTSSNTIELTWCPASPGIDFMKFYSRDDATDSVHTDSSTYLSNSTFVYSRYHPSTTYAFWIRAGNEWGLSESSDTMHVSTREPLPPDNLISYYYDDQEVYLAWQNRNYGCDSILIARRDTLSIWNTIAVIAINRSNNYPSSFLDSSVRSQTVYYYRVGMSYFTHTWWSEDSSSVWVP